MDVSKINPNLDEVTEAMLKLPQADCPVEHIFAPGIYIRKLSVKAGTFMIGRKHRKGLMNIFIKGAVRFKQDDGTVKEMTAPKEFMGQPGQKVGLVLEDMIWLNVYATDKTNIDEIEKEIFEDCLELEAAKENQKLLPNNIDQESFKKTIEALGFTEEQVRAMSEHDDLIPLPYGSHKIKVGPSQIQGQGLFATADMKVDEPIALARSGNNRTIAGRFTNHSAHPNARMLRVGRDMYLVALKDIQGCKGGLDGDEITIDYGQSYIENMLSLQGG